MHMTTQHQRGYDKTLYNLLRAAGRSGWNGKGSGGVRGEKRSRRFRERFCFFTDRLENCGGYLRVGPPGESFEIGYTTLRVRRGIHKGLEGRAHRAYRRLFRLTFSCTNASQESHKSILQVGHDLSPTLRWHSWHRGRPNGSSKNSAHP